MPKITINKDRCKGCVLCVGVCPKNSIALSKKLNKNGVRPAIYKDKDCTGCMQCVLICPDVCIEVYK